MPPAPRLSEYGNGLAAELESTRALLIGQLGKDDDERQATFASTKALQTEVY